MLCVKIKTQKQQFNLGLMYNHLKKEKQNFEQLNLAVCLFWLFVSIRNFATKLINGLFVVEQGQTENYGMTIKYS